MYEIQPLSVEDEIGEYLERMGKEANRNVSDLVEIAIFNLVALWLRDKHPEESVVSDDGVDEPE